MAARISLHDGRTLACAESGASGGTPVFFFHGTPGSRLFRPPDEVTGRLGVRLICAERPGYGQSTFQPGRRIVDWPADVAALADALGLAGFAVIGHSGGGPHALACAHALPDRVTAAGVVSGAGPVDTPRATDGMIFLHRLGFVAGRYLPWPARRLLVGWMLREIAADPTKAVDRDRDAWPPADRALFTRPDIRELCIRSDTEAYRHGLLAYAWEARLLTRPWGFALSEIRVPVRLWHGTADNSTTLAMARHMAASIAGAELTICEEEGHMLLMPRWEEILRAIRARS